MIKQNILYDKLKEIVFLLAVILGSFLLFSPSVFAVGYAPLGVLGTVTEGGTEPTVVEGASVVVKVFIDGIETGLAQTIQTDADGIFFTTVTVRDGQTVDLQIIIQPQESELYVELVRDAQGWIIYEIPLNLDDESFGQDAQELTGRGINRPPSSPEFIEDMETLLEGELEPELLEKYGLIEVPLDSSEEETTSGMSDDAGAGARPVTESPTVVRIDGLEESNNGSADMTEKGIPSWALIIIISMIVVLVVMRATAHRQKKEPTA